MCLFVRGLLYFVKSSHQLQNQSSFIFSCIYIYIFKVKDCGMHNIASYNRYIIIYMQICFLLFSIFFGGGEGDRSLIFRDVYLLYIMPCDQLKESSSLHILHACFIMFLEVRNSLYYQKKIKNKIPCIRNYSSKKKSLHTFYESKFVSACVSLWLVVFFNGIMELSVYLLT